MKFEEWRSSPQVPHIDLLPLVQRGCRMLVGTLSPSLCSVLLVAEQMYIIYVCTKLLDTLADKDGVDITNNLVKLTTVAEVLDHTESLVHQPACTSWDRSQNCAS